MAMTQKAAVSRSLRRSVWALVGALALAIGAVGAVLPILPTTPFVILAAFAFARSAPRLALWIENSAHFGPLLADWRDHGAIAPRYKRLAMAMMGLAVVAALWAGAPLYAIALQLLCIAGAAAFILTRPDGPAAVSQPPLHRDSQPLPVSRHNL